MSRPFALHGSFVEVTTPRHSMAIMSGHTKNAEEKVRFRFYSLPPHINDLILFLGVLVLSSYPKPTERLSSYDCLIISANFSFTSLICGLFFADLSIILITNVVNADMLHTNIFG